MSILSFWDFITIAILSTQAHFIHSSVAVSVNELNKSGCYNICKFKIYFHNVFWGFQSLLFIDRNIKNKFYPIFIQVNDRQLNFPEKLHGTPSGKFTRSDFHTFVFPVLASMVSYHKYLDRNRAVSEGRGRGMCFCSKLSFVEIISLFKHNLYWTFPSWKRRKITFI